MACLLGIIGFNLLAPFLFEKQAGFDGNQMLWAAVTALLCAELGPEWASGWSAGSHLDGISESPGKRLSPGQGRMEIWDTHLLTAA